MKSTLVILFGTALFITATLWFGLAVLKSLTFCLWEVGCWLFALIAMAAAYGVSKKCDTMSLNRKDERENED